MTRWLHNNSLTDILVSGSGSMIAPIINFSAIPIVMRIYGPAEYGSWVLIMSLALILGNVATFRYELSLVLARNDRETDHLLVLCVLLVSLVTIAAFLLVLATPFWVRYVPSINEVASSLWAFPLLTFLIGLSWVGRSFCTRQKAFVYNSMSFIVFASVTNCIQILAPRFGLTGSSGLIAGSISGWFAAVFVLLVGWWRFAPHNLFREISLTELVVLARTYRNFPKYTVPYTFIGTLRLEGVKLLLGSYGNSALVGDFSFAQRLTNFPVTLFCGGIRPVLFQRAARSEDHVGLELFIRRIMMVLVLMVVPLVVPLELKMDLVFGFIAGEDWAGAVPYARILVLPAMGMMLTGWMDRLFDVRGRQGLALLLQTVFTAIGIVGFLVGLYMLDNPHSAVLIQGLITLGHYLLASLVVYRIFNFPVSKLIWVSYFPVGLILIVFCSYRIFSGFAGEWMALGLGVMAAWSAGALILKNKFSWSS